jgi:rubredoxin
MAGMSSETEALPAGATVYRCPLCDWVFAQPPGDAGIRPAADIFEAISAAMARAEAELTAMEAAVQAHLGTHGLLDWLTEVTRLRDEVARLEGEIRRLAVTGLPAPTAVSAPDGSRPA